MSLNYVGGVPDWCGEAANRKRLEAWYEGFGPGGLPCGVCDLSKLRQDFRRLAQHLQAGKEQVKLNPARAGAPPRTWAINLLAAPPALIGGEPSEAVEIVQLQLSCSRCHHVLLFDAKAIGIAV